MAARDDVEHPLLTPLTPDERAHVLAQGAEVSTPPGTVLATQGTPSPALHLLLDGTVRVVRDTGDGRHELAVLGAGSWIGESALLGGPATATVEARTAVRSFAVPADRAAAAATVDGLVLQLDARARRRRAAHRALELPPLELGGTDAGRLQLRPVWPDDWRQLDLGRDRVSQRSLEQRFFTVPPLTERTLRRLAAVDFADQFAWAVLVDGTLGGIGRYALQAEDRGTAELAVLVADDLHGHGLGTVLVAALTAAADAHGADTLLAIARADNVAVRRLLDRFGARWDGPVDGVVQGRWPVREALDALGDTPLLRPARDIAATVLHEVTEDGAPSPRP